MIYIRKNEEFTISALLALLCLPVSLFLGMASIHVGGLLTLAVFPILILTQVLEWIGALMEYWGVVGAPDENSGNGSGIGGFWEIAILLAVQFLGYFLFIWLTFKTLRKLKIIGEPGPVVQKAEHE